MAPRGGELRRRVAVAVIGIPLVLAALYAGGWWFGAVVAGVAVLATGELFGLADARGVRPFGGVGMVASGAIVLLATARPTPGAAAAPMLVVLVTLVLITLTASVWLRWPAGAPLGTVAVTLFGSVYVGGALAFAVFLRNIPATLVPPSVAPSWPAMGFVLLPLVSVWIGDSTAFFAGHAFGRHKLFPTASPGKTIEGGIAGLLGSAVAGALVAAFALADLPGANLPVAMGALVGAVVGIAAPLGDVAESVLKREAGVKDSGTLLPGHGGFLDRIDSLLFALPVAYGVLALIGENGVSGPLRVAILGSTGSIGKSTLEVISRHPDRFQVVALAAHRSLTGLCEQVARVRPRRAIIVDAAALGAARDLPPGRWEGGRDALLSVVADPEVDVVVNALVGAAGLEPTLAALEAGKRLALANKESLVSGGPLVLEAAKRGGGELIPIDSEHSAILQCLAGSDRGAVARIVLTASGGPFRGWNRSALEGVRPSDALRHPTWAMGAKITIDSATLANKALEVIEAHHLYGIPYQAIEVVVHPQSIVHSFVEFVDGSVLAQLGFPTMELPILYALSHPERVDDARLRTFDPVRSSPLTFEAVDRDLFPLFGIGQDAGRRGGTAPAVFNAANEVAVEAFLGDRIDFTAIGDVVAGVLDEVKERPVTTVTDVLDADRAARAAACVAVERAAGARRSGAGGARA